MPGLSFSNELISRDEGMHCDFACLLYKVGKGRRSTRYNYPMYAVRGGGGARPLPFPLFSLSLCLRTCSRSLSSSPYLLSIFLNSVTASLSFSPIDSSLSLSSALFCCSLMLPFLSSYFTGPEN